MLSDGEKQRIIERVRFEQDVRKSLPQDTEKHEAGFWKQAWDALNGGLALLIMGAVVSAIIVPIFQDRMQEAEWKRQVAAEYVNSHLGTMRDCLKDVTQVGASASQVVELGKQIENPDTLSLAEYKFFRAQMMQIESSRIERSANALALSPYFPDPAGTRTAIRDYDEKTQRYTDQVDRFLETKFAHSHATNAEDVRQLDIRLDRFPGSLTSQIGDINKSYDDCLDKLGSQISQREASYENFNFLQKR